VYGKKLNNVSLCAVSPVVLTSNISSCQKKNFFSFPVAVNNSIKVGPLVFFVINVCSYGEHCETPCTFCHTVFISEQRATSAPCNINGLVFITEKESVYSAVRTGSLNKNGLLFVFKGLSNPSIWILDGQ